MQRFYAGKRTLAAAERDLEPRGSNGIAIAPALTTDGKALLLINPHTSFFFRSEQQVTSDEGLNAYGAATWGQFFIYQGFNAHAGWMHTSSGVDNVDEFAEKVERTGKRRCYRYGSECRPLVARPVTIRYRATDGTLGQPQLSRPGGPTTARSSAQANGRWIAFAMMDRPVAALQQSFLRTKARDLAAFLKVAELKANSSNNTIFADAKGEIAYLHPQFVPQAQRPVRLYRSRSTAATPPPTGARCMRSPSCRTSISPPNGWVQNTNTWPYRAAGPFSPDPTHFPKYMDMFGENYRGIHALQLLTGAAAGRSTGCRRRRSTATSRALPR